MEQKKNIFRRIWGIYLNDRETFREVAEHPTNLMYIFLLLVGIVTIFMFYLIQVPSGLNSIIIIASTFPISLIILLFMVFMVAGALIYYLVLYIICMIGTRLRKSRKEHRQKKVIFNLYIYSLAPFLVLATQIPFILILGGHYSLFALKPYFLFLLGLTTGWHLVKLYRAIQTNSDITARRAKLLTILYIAMIAVGVAFIVYAVLYINFDISWLGSLG